MNPMASPTSALDFNALTRLKGEAAHDPAKAARKAAEQFESYFLQQMMKEMRATIEKSELSEGHAMETYQDLMDKEVAQQMVRRGGIGLANMLEQQMLKQQAAAVSTQDALRLHPGGTSLPLQPATGTALPLGKPETSKGYELRERGGRP